MRVIPIKQYKGKLPEGYAIKDFIRFDEADGECYGVLYSGERVNINSKPVSVEYKQSLMTRIWSGIKRIF